MEPSKIKQIKALRILRVLCIIGLFVPILPIFSVTILYYKIGRKISHAVLVCAGMFLPIIHWFIIFYAIMEANKTIKSLYISNENNTMVFSEQDLSQYEDEINIDENALKKYLSYKK